MNGRDGYRPDRENRDRGERGQRGDHYEERYGSGDRGRGFRGRPGGRHGHIYPRANHGRPIVGHEREDSAPGSERSSKSPSTSYVAQTTHISSARASAHASQDHPATEYNSPWISILQIKDGPTRKKLEERYNELDQVDRELASALRECWQLQRALQTLEHHAAREALQVQQTSEKLDELSYL